jgi:hypothetical protein
MAGFLLRDQDHTREVSGVSTAETVVWRRTDSIMVDRALARTAEMIEELAEIRKVDL